MEKIEDYAGHSVRFTDERRAHVLEHPEMVDLLRRLPEVLRYPKEVRRSRSDANVHLHYATYPNTSFGEKLLCVVVRLLPDEAW